MDLADIGYLVDMLAGVKDELWLKELIDRIPGPTVTNTGVAGFDKKSFDDQAEHDQMDRIRKHLGVRDDRKGGSVYGSGRYFKYGEEQEEHLELDRWLQNLKKTDFPGVRDDHMEGVGSAYLEKLLPSGRPRKKKRQKLITEMLPGRHDDRVDDQLGVREDSLELHNGIWLGTGVGCSHLTSENTANKQTDRPEQ